jgi:hypothetical protein
MFPARPFLVAVAALAVIACEGPEDPARNDSGPVPPANEANLSDVLPLPEPALDRAGFLAAMASAASAHVSGANNEEARTLDGHRFAIRIRFGCDGPAPADGSAALRWSAAKDGKSYDIYARPDLSQADEAPKAMSDETIEAIEGFWIPRPWELRGECPVPAADDAEARLPVPQLVGIAQYFTAADSRVGRRSGRPYVATQKIASPAELPKSGLVLLLEGRFEAWPGGDVIRCIGSGRGQRPSCVASAHLDRAAFLKPEDSSVIAEWRD